MSDPISRALRRIPAGDGHRRPSLTPGSTYEALLDQRLSDLAAQVSELKGRINGLVFLVIGAVIVDLTLRLVR